MSFGSLLVANRGEISVRIIHAARELGLETVAVYSEADRGALHRRLADRSYPIGPSPAAGSYLNIERLMEVLEESGAQAVHPGYGFLSESAAFARAVEEAGAVWVGPPAEAMELAGDKVAARSLAREVKIPVVEGYDGFDQGEDRLLEEARRIGYPVMIKASAGGGGRGMRAVRGPEEFIGALRSARREAGAAFGEGTVFLERLLEQPRHVEVQVMGDLSGNVVHFWERECSVQRRHQKVIEESPAPALEDGLRLKMCEAAVRLARRAGYRNAGTVEFLVCGEEFYFLEINARLQVEHPVTEAVTGRDLVRLQLGVAAGDPLPPQEEIVPRGHAIEARVYAEDANGMPVGGRLLDFETPGGAGVRNDVGVEVGDEVPIHYDPMLAKLIVFGEDRKGALARLKRALVDYRVDGVPTNLPVLQRIVSVPDFAAGRTTTAFLEEHALTEPPQRPPPTEALALGAVGDMVCATAPTTEPFTAGPWRLLGAATLRYLADGEDYELTVRRTPKGGWVITCGGQTCEVEVISFREGRLSAVVDGHNREAGYVLENAGLVISLGGESYSFIRIGVQAAEAAYTGAGVRDLTAPMPGTVVEVFAREGERVRERQPLLTLEAMKMEHTVVAPADGVLLRLPFGEGQRVPGGALLAEIGEEDVG